MDSAYRNWFSNEVSGVDSDTRLAITVAENASGQRTCEHLGCPGDRDKLVQFQPNLVL